MLSHSVCLNFVGILEKSIMAHLSQSPLHIGGNSSVNLFRAPSKIEEVPIAFNRLWIRFCRICPTLILH